MMSKWKRIGTLAIAVMIVTFTTADVGAQTVLFADNFDRADNTDLNADTAGKSGTLGALDWVEVKSGGEPQIVGNEMRLGETGGGGGGWSIAYVDHNFTDTDIITAGEFTVTVDLVSAASNGGTRFTGFVVGNSKTEVDNWSSNNPNTGFTSDFFFGYDTTGTNEVRVYINGTTQDFQQAVNLDSGGNLSVRFSSITDFNSGSTVNYEAFVDGGSVKTGSFTWSGTNENYLALYSNYTLNRGVLDNFAISTAGCSPGDTDGDGDIDTGDLTTSIQNFTGAGGSTTKTCEEGDTDEDGDVDTGDLTFSIQNFTGAQAGNAGVPDLVYDPATGNVTIDADGADVISFSLQSGPFNAADFSDLPAGLTDNIASQIGWTSFNLFSGLTGTANLGAILPAGLDLAQLEAALSTASYGLALSGGGGGGRLDIIIPEPASMVLMGLGAVALVRRRRAA